MTPSSSVFVSVVASLRNDAEVVEAFVAQAIELLRTHYEHYELVLVDDGSTDATVARLRPLLQRYECMRVLRLSRQFGAEIALTAGLETAIGDFVVTLTPGADPLEMIPELVESARLKGGVVCGVDIAASRQGWVHRALASVFYTGCRKLLGIDVIPRATNYRVLSRQALNAIVRIKDKHRFLQVFTPYIGFEPQYVRYVRKPRPGRRDGSALFDAVNRGIDLIVTSSMRPLRIVTWLGLLAGGLNIAYIAYIAAVALFKRKIAEGWVTLSFQHAVMFFLLFLILAVLAEYLGRVLSESRDRPLYFIHEDLTSSTLVPAAERRNVVRESL